MPAAISGNSFIVDVQPCKISPTEDAVFLARVQHASNGAPDGFWVKPFFLHAYPSWSVLIARNDRRVKQFGGSLREAGVGL